MIKLILSFLLLSTLSFAEDFQISGKLYSFDMKGGVLVSHCEKNCLALDALKTHKITKKALEKFPKKRFVGALGSEICENLYKAQAVLGRAQNRDGRAFCVFSDSSMIEINSLSEYAELALKKK